MWGLDERICRDDFLKRWILFKYLIQSVMAYGVELWGWEEKRIRKNNDGLYKMGF